jgi:hypothetical protein
MPRQLGHKILYLWMVTAAVVMLRTLVVSLYNSDSIHDIPLRFRPSAISHADTIASLGATQVREHKPPSGATDSSSNPPNKPPASASTTSTGSHNIPTARWTDDKGKEWMPCVRWVTTDNCDPQGARKPEHDRACDYVIEGGGILFVYFCIIFSSSSGLSNPSLTRSILSIYMSFSSLQTGWSGYCECEGGEQRGLSNCNHNTFTCEEVCTGHPPFVEQPKPKDPALALVKCEGWKQTGQCEPNGPRESQYDTSCDHTVDSGEFFVRFFILFWVRTDHC